jgi:hypothetical protein
VAGGLPGGVRMLELFSLAALPAEAEAEAAAEAAAN